MTWANVRAAVVSAVEALTPSTTGPYGGTRYLHVVDENITNAVDDREFSLVLNRGPAQLSDSSTQTPRYLSEFELSVYYLAGDTRAGDDERRAQDAAQLQTALLSIANLGTDAAGIVPNGDTYFGVNVDRDADDNCTLRISGVVHHF
jgi:hypothetical protein